MKFAKFLRTPILKNICERPTASLICNIAYKFSITLSFSSILRISTVNSEFSIKIQTMSPVLNATTGTVHAQRSYLTVAPLTYVEWRSGLKRCYTERFVWYDLCDSYSVLLSKRLLLCIKICMIRFSEDRMSCISSGFDMVWRDYKTESVIKSHKNRIIQIIFFKAAFKSC